MRDGHSSAGRMHFCGHPGAFRTVALIAFGFHGNGGCGGLHRSAPTGGVANGTPSHTCPSSLARPITGPSSRFTVTSMKHCDCAMKRRQTTILFIDGVHWWCSTKKMKRKKKQNAKFEQFKKEIELN